MTNKSHFFLQNSFIFDAVSCQYHKNDRQSVTVGCTLKEGCLLLSSADAGAAYTSIGAQCTVPVLLDNIFTNAMQIIIS